MEDSPKNEVGDTSVVKKECTTCKFVLIFAFVVFILVVIFVLFIRPQLSTPVPSQMPIQETMPLTGADIDRLMRDQGGIITTPADPHVQPTTDGVQSGGGGGVPKK